MYILTVNLLFSTFVFWVAARIYLLPRLHELKPKTVLLPIAPFIPASRTDVPGAGRYLCRHPAAIRLSGDLLAAILALVSIPAVSKGHRSGRILVWVFNIVGSLDLLAAIALATIYGASAYMGPAYWIPAFWVPALLVTHYTTFIILVKYWAQA